MSGVITDRSGAAVPQAVITIANKETQNVSTTQSDSEGRYVVPALRPGRYTLKVEAPGFKQFVRSEVAIEVDQRLRLDTELEVGAVTESVQVTGQAALVESEGSSLGAVVSNRHLLNMPLNIRNTVQLAGLVPGVVLGRGFGDAFNSAAAVLINGGRGNTSEILTDGVSNTTPAANPINTVSIFPPVDAIQEFKVHSNNLSAEFGRTGGGVLNFVFKSGTNDLHGSAFEFLRNSALDANNFFGNRQGVPLTSFRRNQFGGAIGGPIVIPGLVNGRDKFFFFTSYEGLRESTRNTATFTFATQAERAGDFSRTSRVAVGQCQPVSIFDPFSTRPVAGGGFVRTQFPGNVIPANLQDPVAVRAASYFPLPLGPGDACSGANNFTASNPTKGAVDQTDTRIDVNPTANDKIFFRVSIRRLDRVGADHYKTIGAPNGDRLGSKTPGRNASLSYTRILGPTLIAEGRIGMARMREFAAPAAGEDFDMRSALGFEGRFIEQMNRPLSFPRINVAGYGGLGTGGQAFTDQWGTSYQAAGSLTKIAGAHTWKTGVDYRVLQAVGPNGFNTSGVFDFGPAFTQGPDPNRAGATVGNGMASFLTGLGTGSVQLIPFLLTSNNYLGLFIQDDYRVTRKLVLNFGLRYDLENGRKDRYDHLSWFDFTVPSPLAQRVPSLPNLRGGLKFVNVDGNPKRQYDLDANNFGPRFGFAYSLNRLTVVRGGYAMYYEPYSGRASSSGAGYTGFSAITTWVSSIDGFTPENRFRNPFPNGLNLPPGSSGGLLTAVGESLGATSRDGAFDRTARVGYVQQWNFTVQREL
ncbi:MAG: carboxypeptidase regulatory-like domain-containing protein, partial [Gammaproteobacteria bacterium]